MAKKPRGNISQIENIDGIQSELGRYLSLFCQVDILQPNEIPPRCNIPSQRVRICHPVIISLPTKSKLQCEITSGDVCRWDAITRRDDIIVTRRYGISHRGVISLGCNMST